MGFVQVCLTLACVTAGCVFFLITDGDADCSGSAESNASVDCSAMQWSLVDTNHISESNGLILSSAALLGFRRLCLYTVVATVLYVVLDPGEWHRRARGVCNDLPNAMLLQRVW